MELRAKESLRAVQADSEFVFSYYGGRVDVNEIPDLVLDHHSTVELRGGRDSMQTGVRGLPEVQRGQARESTIRTRYPQQVRPGKCVYTLEHVFIDVCIYSVHMPLFADVGN